MGWPGIEPAHVTHAVLGATAPLVGVAQQAQQLAGDRLPVQRIDQQAVMAVADDIHRASVLGGHHRQAGRCGLEQGQAERLGERRVEEHPAPRGGQTVDFRHLRRPVMLGHGHLAVEVEEIDQQQCLLQHLLRPPIHLPDIVAVASDNHQVGGFLQLGGPAVGLDHGRNVLALVGAREQQDEGFLRLFEKMLQIARKRVLAHPVRMRVEQLEIGPRGNDRHAVRMVEIIQLVLVFHLVVRAGDHQAGIGERFLFGLDAPRNVVTLLDIIAFEPRE